MRRQTDEEIEKQKKQQKIRISISKAARRSGKVTKKREKFLNPKGRQRRQGHKRKLLQ